MPNSRRKVKERDQNPCKFSSCFLDEWPSCGAPLERPSLLSRRSEIHKIAPLDLDFSTPVKSVNTEMRSLHEITVRPHISSFVGLRDLEPEEPLFFKHTSSNSCTDLADLESKEESYDLRDSRLTSTSGATRDSASPKAPKKLNIKNLSAVREEM